ncbi:MAG: ABC transporter permease [Anaerolineae bacterium]|nr:ABC transporter permease [Anaerolineae bacterium]
MNKVWQVARQEFVTNVRRSGFIIATIAVPAVLALAVAIAGVFGGQMGKFFEETFAGKGQTVAYVDYSGIFTPPLPAYADTYIPYADEETAKAALLAGEISSYIVIAEDYLQSGQVTAYSKSSSFFSSAIAVSEENIQDFFTEHLLAGQVAPELQARVVDPLHLTPVALDEQGQPTSKGAMAFISTFVVPYLFAILLMITIFTSSGFLLQGVGEEKENRVIEILLSSLSTTQLLAGKILGLGALGLLQVLIWLGAGFALMSGAVAVFALSGLLTIRVSTVVLALVYFLLGYLLFATMMASAGALGSTAREGQQISGIFSFLSALPFMFGNFIMMQPNATLAKVLSLFPLTAPITMMMRLAVTTVPPLEVAISLVLLALGILGVLWAGGKLFRFGLLMYGKRPSVAEMWRALRQA